MKYSGCSSDGQMKSICVQNHGRCRNEMIELGAGEDLVGGSAEIRIPLIAPRFITLNFFNLHQFNTMRFGIYAALFADVGKIWFRANEFLRSSMAGICRSRAAFPAPLRFDPSNRIIRQCARSISRWSYRRPAVLITIWCVPLILF